jgi:hypothetical protein
MGQHPGVTAASPAAQQGVIPASPADQGVPGESPAPAQSVPYDRFQQVNEEKNNLIAAAADQKAQLDAMSAQLTEIQSNPASLFQKQQEQASQVPDMYSDPEGFVKHVQEQAIQAAKGFHEGNANKIKEEEAYIQSEFATIQQAHGEVDQKSIGEFAKENGIINPSNGRFNIVKAHELMLKMAPQTAPAPISTRSGDPATAPQNISMEDYGKLGRDGQLAFLAQNNS